MVAEWATGFTRGAKRVTTLEGHREAGILLWEHPAGVFVCLRKALVTHWLPRSSFPVLQEQVLAVLVVETCSTGSLPATHVVLCQLPLQIRQGDSSGV